MFFERASLGSADQARHRRFDRPATRRWGGTLSYAFRAKMTRKLHETETSLITIKYDRSTTFYLLEKDIMLLCPRLQNEGTCIQRRLCLFSQVLGMCIDSWVAAHLFRYSYQQSTPCPRSCSGVICSKVNTNLAFIISQFPDEWLFFAKRQLKPSCWCLKESVRTRLRFGKPTLRCNL